MLASESTFIFPKGLAASEPAGSALLQQGSCCSGIAEEEEGAGAASSSGWGLGSMQQQQQQVLPQLQRQTSSAPGGSGGGRLAGELLHSSGAGPTAARMRTATTTAQGPCCCRAGRRASLPCGGALSKPDTPASGELSWLISRNADRLQLLSSMPGDPEALDAFLKQFVSSGSQVRGLLAVRTDSVPARGTHCSMQYTYI